MGIMPYVRSLPDGLDTFIKDPSSLSSGQRQQINIARAMVKDAPLLILDEATSSVDTRTERHIQEAMDRLMSGRTSFIIAHRLSTIKTADRILVIRKGKVVEQGTHEELLSKNGFYRDLYDSQFESCE
ncbi:MAG: ATP-binding cassette domain-containing protein [Candidatus Methanomethylophilaceae archaeon]|nr:ATP-binding cassette domain-containing protein [Candidatus Methanomethylophilaceae archaeon]